jgi:PHP family Zn ribbon phosphoesterase
MEKSYYVLKSSFDNDVAIVSASNEKELNVNTERAIREEVNAAVDGKFNLSIGRLGDYGEYTEVKASYVQGKHFIKDEFFYLIKTVTY